MNKVHILCDSTADLPEELLKTLKVIPLVVCFGKKEYRDGVELSKEKFYKKLEKAKELPTTSQPSPAEMDELFRKITQDGDSAVLITISSKLSGTYQTALFMSEEYPEIHVVDSKNVAMATGALVELALKLADEGKTAKEIVAELEKARGRLHFIAVLDTLENLRKGGRISRAAAVAGTLLNIKPVIQVLEDGTLGILGKARGNKLGNQMMMKKANEGQGIDFEMPVILGYTGTSDVLLRKFRSESEDFWKEHESDPQEVRACSVVGVHGGPGAIAIGYFSKESE